MPAPVSKAAWHLAGFRWPGHTELLAHRTKAKRHAMAFAGPRFRVVLATTHLPLMDVRNVLTIGRVFDSIDLGADLCTPEGETRGYEPLRVAAGQVDRLEREIDAMNAALQPLNSFILPGGSAAAAYLHLSRTVARRAERQMTALAANEPINDIAIQYINRLSDHLFVLARHCNNDGADDVLWVPGANR